MVYYGQVPNVLCGSNTHFTYTDAKGADVTITQSGIITLTLRRATLNAQHLRRENELRHLQPSVSRQLATVLHSSEAQQFDSPM